MSKKLFIFMLCAIATSAHFMHGAATETKSDELASLYAQSGSNSAALAHVNSRIKALEMGHKKSTAHPEGLRTPPFTIPGALAEEHAALLTEQKTLKAAINGFYVPTKIRFFLDRDFGPYQR